MYCTHITGGRTVPHQVIGKAADEVKVPTVEADNKVKEENMVVAGGRCWKSVLLKALQKTGEFDICSSWKINLSFLQRHWSCPSPPFSAYWLTRSSPFSTTTWSYEWLIVSFSSFYQVLDICCLCYIIMLLIFRCLGIWCFKCCRCQFHSKSWFCWQIMFVTTCL